MIEQPTYNSIYKVVQYPFIILIIISALRAGNSFANHSSDPDLDLGKHLWKDRVLLIFTEDVKSDNYTMQLNAFLNNKKGMSERKLVYYIISPINFKYLNNPPIESDIPWKKYRKSSASFSVQLIGLDGGLKVQRDTVMQANQIFSIIDGMPMRRSEIRNNK